MASNSTKWLGFCCAGRLEQDGLIACSDRFLEAQGMYRFVGHIVTSSPIRIFEAFWEQIQQISESRSRAPVLFWVQALLLASFSSLLGDVAAGARKWRPVVLLWVGCHDR